MSHYSLLNEAVCALAEQAGQGKTVSIGWHNAQVFPPSRPIGQENGVPAKLNFIKVIDFNNLAPFEN
jgi:hypothetical protein